MVINVRRYSAQVDLHKEIPTYDASFHDYKPPTGDWTTKQHRPVHYQSHSNLIQSERFYLALCKKTGTSLKSSP